jgi:hypothetical protein
MSPERFSALAAAYGGDLSRWPAAERESAERLLADKPQAADLLAQARSLDQALATFEAITPTMEVQRRIATAMLRRRATNVRFGRWLSRLGAIGILSAGAAAGAAFMALISISAPRHPDADGMSPLYDQSSFGDAAFLDQAVAASTRT